MMNQLRLFSSFSLDDYQQSTGLKSDTVLPQLQLAKQKGLMEHSNQRWQITSLGHRYLNDLLELFL